MPGGDTPVGATGHWPHQGAKAVHARTLSGVLQTCHAPPEKCCGTAPAVVPAQTRPLPGSMPARPERQLPLPARLERQLPLPACLEQQLPPPARLERQLLRLACVEQPVAAERAWATPMPASRWALRAPRCCRSPAACCRCCTAAGCSAGPGLLLPIHLGPVQEERQPRGQRA